MILCLAAFTAILGCVQPTGRRLDALLQVSLLVSVPPVRSLCEAEGLILSLLMKPQTPSQYEISDSQHALVILRQLQGLTRTAHPCHWPCGLSDAPEHSVPTTRNPQMLPSAVTHSPQSCAETWSSRCCRRHCVRAALTPRRPMPAVSLRCDRGHWTGTL